MKKLFISFAVLVMLSISTVWAQVPNAINYQAIARDNSGGLITNKSISVRVKILSGSSSGNSVYTETFNNVNTNGYGQFTLRIGTGSTSDNFSTIGWGGNSHFLQIEVDVNGGTSYSVVGTQQLVSVPYAMEAKNALTAKDADNAKTANTATTAITANTAKMADSAKYAIKAKDADNAKTANTAISANTANSANTATSANTANTAKMADSAKYAIKAKDADNAKSADVVKSINTFTINDLRNVTPAPNTGQILKWNGTRWVAANDSVGSGSSSTKQWTESGNNIYFNKGYVGIGKNPNHVLDIRGHNSNDSMLMYSYATSNSSGTFTIVHDAKMSAPSAGSLTNVYSGRYKAVSNTSAFTIALVGEADSSTVVNRGVMAVSKGRGTANQGILAIADGASGSSSGNYGLYGVARNSSGDNYGGVGSTSGTGSFNYGLYGISSGSSGSSSANVGIFGVAQSSSGANYGVYGSATTATGNYAGYFNGNVRYTGSLTTPSDRKLKTNIEPIKSAIESIKLLNPSTYDYKTSEFSGLNLPKNKQFGFIAQELESVFPQLVSESVHKESILAGEGYASVLNPGKVTYKPIVHEYKMKEVNYMGLIPILTQAIKEQQNQIEQQQQTIDTLIKRIEKLESK